MRTTPSGRCVRPSGCRPRWRELNQRLLADHGIEFALRVGINTGEVLAGQGRRGLHGDRRRRQRGLAPADAAPARARSPSASARSGRPQRVVEYVPLEPLELKGKAEPVAAWRRGRPVRAAHRRRPQIAPQAPLVGRDDEFAALQMLCSRGSHATHGPHLVTVVRPGRASARPGCCASSSARSTARDPPVRVRRGRCLSFGPSVVYWPLSEMLRAECGIVDGDPDGGRLVEAFDAARVAAGERRRRGRRRRAGSRRSRGCSASRSRAWRQRPTRRTQQSARESFFGAVRAVSGGARAGRAAGARVGGHPLGRRGHARPDRVPVAAGCARRCCRCAWRATSCSSAGPAGARRAARTTSLFLDPLAPADTRELIARCCATPAPSPSVLDVLAERAEGNPLFAEEMVQRLAEEGSSKAAELPDTVQGLLAARLDSLEPFERQLVAHAAVVGRIFWEGALAPVAAAEGGDLQAGAGDPARKGHHRSRRGSAAGRRAGAGLQARPDPRRRLRDAARRRCGRASTSRSGMFIEQRAGERRARGRGAAGRALRPRRDPRRGGAPGPATELAPLREQGARSTARRPATRRARCTPTRRRWPTTRSPPPCGAGDHAQQARIAREAGRRRAAARARRRRDRGVGAGPRVPRRAGGSRARRRAAPQDRRGAGAQGGAHRARSSTTSRAST